jgi:hypothetical protein
LLCVGNPSEAAQRYARYTGLDVGKAGTACTIETARGALTFIDAGTAERALGLRAPALPWIAGYTLDTRDLAATRDHLQRSKVTMRDVSDGQVLVILPQSLGGAIVFQREGSSPLPF